MCWIKYILFFDLEKYFIMICKAIFEWKFLDSLESCIGGCTVRRAVLVLAVAAMRMFYSQTSYSKLWNWLGAPRWALKSIFVFGPRPLFPLVVPCNRSIRAAYSWETWSLLMADFGSRTPWQPCWSFFSLCKGQPKICPRDLFSFSQVQIYSPAYWLPQPSPPFFFPSTQASSLLQSLLISSCLDTSFSEDLDEDNWYPSSLCFSPLAP